MQKMFKTVTSGRRCLWVVGAIAVIVAAVFAFPHANAGTRTAAAEPQTQTTQVKSGDISGSVSASGHLQARQDISLSLQSSGVVKELDVKVGDTVTAGQTLLKLDDTTAQRDLKSAQNALDEAKLDVQSAQVTYNSDAGYKPSDSDLASSSRMPTTPPPTSRPPRLIMTKSNGSQVSARPPSRKRLRKRQIITTRPRPASTAC